MKNKISRREAISTAGKVAAGVVAAGIIAGVGGYLAGSATAAPTTVTETRTVTAAAATITVPTTVTTAVTQTVTKTVGMPAERVKLSLACDAGHNYLPWFDPVEAPMGGHYGQNQAPKISEALGIDISGEEVDPGTEFSIYMADLTGPGKYNIIVYFPTYNGDILGGGWAVPLDAYIEKYRVNLDDLPPVYRYLYCSWAGKVYALPYDGDFHALYYRKDIFADPEIRRRFRDRFGRDLEPPKTYEEYLQTAEFFNGWDWDKDGEIEYGTVEDFKDLTWGIFFDRFASLGGLWFDEEMNPLVPNDAAVKGLEDLVKIVDYMPPGVLEFGALEVFDCMTKGITAMTLTWPDVGPRAGSGEFPVKGDQVGTALVPGYVVGGKLIRYSWTGVGRVMIITVNTPEDKREAAFRVLKWMYDTSVFWVPSGLNGEDPFAYSHTSPGALPHWKKANPAWSEEGILDYIRASAENFARGYPDLYLPGAAQYTDVLSRYIMMAVKKEISAREAISRTVEEWRSITKDLGEDKQKNLWKQQIVEYKRAGIWPR
ncbi:MAG: extracellular solute-binding protein [Candidatus Caldarchaeales archaeon]